MTMTFYCEPCQKWTFANLNAGWPRCNVCYHMYECRECGYTVYEDGSCTRTGCTANRNSTDVFAPPNPHDIVVYQLPCRHWTTRDAAIYFDSEAEALNYIGAF